MGFILTPNMELTCQVLDCICVSFEGSRRKRATWIEFCRVENVSLLRLFNRFLAWLQILHQIIAVQELFDCLLSLLLAVQPLERNTHSVLGLPLTCCSVIQHLYCDLRVTGELLQCCDSLFQRVWASSSEWIVLLVCVAAVKRAWHNAHSIFFSWSFNSV